MPEVYRNINEKRAAERVDMMRRLKRRDAAYAAKNADALANVRGRVPGGCHWPIRTR